MGAKFTHRRTRAIRGCRLVFERWAGGLAARPPYCRMSDNYFPGRDPIFVSL